MHLGAPEIAILEWLASHEQATAAEIGSACGIMANSTRGRLIVLQSHQLVTGQRCDAVSRAKSYTITSEGLRRLEQEPTNPDG